MSIPITSLDVRPNLVPIEPAVAWCVQHQPRAVMCTLRLNPQTLRDIRQAYFPPLSLEQRQEFRLYEEVGFSVVDQRAMARIDFGAGCPEPMETTAPAEPYEILYPVLPERSRCLS